MRKDVVIKKLPNQFIFNDVLSVSDWEKRREEILNDVIDLEYGGMPPKPNKVTLEQLTERRS